MDRMGPDDLLASLDVAFDAALAREEDAAAADLAVSLFQDRCLTDVVARAGPREIVLDVGRVPLEHVGADFVAGRGFVVPLRHTVVVDVPVGAPPATASIALVELLRRLARSRSRIRIGLAHDQYDGVLTACGRDFLSLSGPREERLVALAGLRWLRVLEEEAFDA